MNLLPATLPRLPGAPGPSVPHVDPRGTIGAGAPADPTLTPDADDSEIRAVAEGLYAQIVYQMLQQMRSTVPEGGLMELGAGGDTFHGMFDQEIADRIAQQDHSIVREIERQLAGRIR